MLNIIKSTALHTPGLQYRKNSNKSPLVHISAVLNLVRFYSAQAAARQFLFHVPCQVEKAAEQLNIGKGKLCFLKSSYLKVQ
jgi:hypothetical protein